MAERLLDEGHEVIGIDIRKPSHELPGLNFFYCDISDETRLASLMSGIEVVHHTAALVPLTKKYNEFWNVNVEGSRRVAHQARLAKVEFFIHTSSSAIFGKTEDSAITNKDPLEPIEPYGLSKLKGEEAVIRELDGTKTRYALIRPRTILGTERGGIFDLFFRWIANGDPIFTIGSGENKFQFVHVDDLIDAMMLVTSKRVSGKFNVGTNSYESLNELFNFLIGHARSNSRIIHLPVKFTIFSLTLLEKIKLSPLAPWHYKTFHNPFYFDLQDLNKLGWAPRYSNKQLICMAYDSYLDWSEDVANSDASPHRGRLAAGVLTPIQKLLKWFL